MARPTLLTPELLGSLCEQLAQGIPKTYAAAYVGIGVQTMKDWEQKGKHAAAKQGEGAELTDSEQKYLFAAEHIALARSYGVAWLMHQVLDAAGGEKAHLKKWQAYMTILERTHADDFRRRSSAEYVTADKAPAARIDVSHLDLEEREALRTLLSKARGAE